MVKNKIERVMCAGVGGRGFPRAQTSRSTKDGSKERNLVQHSRAYQKRDSQQTTARVVLPPL